MTMAKNTHSSSFSLDLLLSLFVRSFFPSGSVSCVAEYYILRTYAHSLHGLSNSGRKEDISIDQGSAEDRTSF